MDYIIDIPDYTIYDTIMYDTLSDIQRQIYNTHIYIVNNMKYNMNYNIIYNNYDEISEIQYFNIMSFLDEIS
jgi:hypothetical protein